MQEYKTDRAVRTRDALISAGFDLMLERPIENIPIDDLVSVAGVGKGSFFNHFGDKDGFKKALAVQVRSEMETQVTNANSGVDNPLERIAGGMCEVTNYALINRKRTIVVLRMSAGATRPDYTLNEGLRDDIRACIKARLIRQTDEQACVLYWLGLCVTMMTFVAESKCGPKEAAAMLQKFLIIGLNGLGADETVTLDIADQYAKRLNDLPRG